MNRFVLVSIFSVSLSIASEDQGVLNTQKIEDHESHIEHSSDEAHDDHSEHTKASEVDRHDEHDEHKEHDGDDEHNEHNEHDEHESSKAIGAGKAIMQTDEANGFKLSPEAIKSLNLKFSSISLNQSKIEKSSLVSSKNSKGIYRYREGFFKFIPVEILNEQDKFYEIRTREVHAGDQMVVSGLGLLRVADVYSTDTSEYGHSH